ncbi:MAG TPA: cytochrome ubiquinol oxidase subunit I, partial [Ornithinicoccus sp.]|nr:cytochrome ubiquinol oxidase subunit I [Ornithinicoccus sp.]
WMTGGGFMLAIALWHVWRSRTPKTEQPMYRKAAAIGAVAVLIGGLGTVVTGDIQGKIMTEVQPMKMAAAEGLYDSVPEGEGAPFSIITVGTLDGSEEVWAVTVPKLLSYLSTGTFDGGVEGINDLNAEYQVTYTGNELTVMDDYRPIIPVTYWTFRLMMGFGFAAMAIAALALLWLWKRKEMQHPFWYWSAIGVMFLPLIANSWGWIFTEMGRQPWLVFGLMTTQTGVSPGTTTGEVLTTMVLFTLLYGVLAVIEVGLILKYTREGAPEFDGVSLDPKDRAEDEPFVFTY